MPGPDPSLEGEDLHLEPISPLLLPPHSRETILVLLAISATMTTLLHSCLLTHILGILVLASFAYLINLVFYPISRILLARKQCVNDQTETCATALQRKLEDIPGYLVSWISAVRPEQTIRDPKTTLYTQAGQRFLTRAGIIGAITTFVLVYVVLYWLYEKAYARSVESASIKRCNRASATGKPEDEEKWANRDRGNGSLAVATKDSLYFSSRFSKSLVHLTAVDIRSSVDPREDRTTCCTACDALEIAQEEWIDAVRQYDEENNKVFEENEALKVQIAELQAKVSCLLEVANLRDDRIQYLEVLLEEAGRQMCRGSEIKDILWESYCNHRNDNTEQEESQNNEINDNGD